MCSVMVLCLLISIRDLCVHVGNLEGRIGQVERLQGCGVLEAPLVKGSAPRDQHRQRVANTRDAIDR